VSLPVRSAPQVSKDIEAIAGYIAADNLEAAMGFIAAVEQTIHSLAHYPDRGALLYLEHPSLSGVRWLRVTGYKHFLVFYCVAASHVYVIRVLHGSRDLPAVFDDDE
jgi:toxin ParE1/3/4